MNIRQSSQIDITVKPDVSLLHTDEECAAMIELWLKRNKPSVRIKHNIKMPHLEQVSSCVGITQEGIKI